MSVPQGPPWPRARLGRRLLTFLPLALCASAGCMPEVVGNTLVLGIDFESAGQEVHADCIENANCSLYETVGVFDQVDGDLDGARAELAFTLSASGGAVTYDTVAGLSADFPIFGVQTSGNALLVHLGCPLD